MEYRKAVGSEGCHISRISFSGSSPCLQHQQSSLRDPGCEARRLGLDWKSRNPGAEKCRSSWLLAPNVIQWKTDWIVELPHAAQ